MGAILSLGSINADFQVRVDRLASGSGTRLGRDLLRASGGKAANVAILARRLGADSRLLGAVGDDDLAGQALDGPRREGVDLTGVVRAGGPTGMASIAVAPDADKSIILALDANDACGDHAEVIGREVAGAPAGSVLVVDLEVSLSCVQEAVRAARSAGFPVVLDPAPPQRLPQGLLEAVDHVTPDHTEAQELTGIPAGSPEGAARAARALYQRGAGTAYVKLASGGCAVASATGSWTVEAPSGVDSVDSTGAGDAFAGALAWSLLTGGGAVEAAGVAVAASACAVERYGSQKSYPSGEQLDSMRSRVAARSRLGGDVGG